MLNTPASQTTAAPSWITPTLKSAHISEHTSVDITGVGPDFGVFS